MELTELTEIETGKKPVPEHLAARLAQFEELDRQKEWADLYRITHQATNGPDTGAIWDEIQYYRGRAAEQVGEWGIGAFSWLWCAQQDGITEDEAVLRLNHGILCYIRNGELDLAEKTLFDEIADWPEGDFSSVFEEFRRMNFLLCFNKPEDEWLASLIEVTAGMECELDRAHEWSKELQELPPCCLSDIIHRMTTGEFMILYELCRNPALEEIISRVMSERASRYIQRDREYYRYKCDLPCFTLKEALWVKRKADRLARVSRAMRQSDEYDLPAECYATIPRLAP